MDGTKRRRSRFMGGLLAGVVCSIALLSVVAGAAVNQAPAGTSEDPSSELDASRRSESAPASLVTASPGTPDLAETGTRLFSATLVVIGLLALGAYGVRWLMNRRGVLSRPGTMIRVVTTRSLGGRSSLAVVEIGDERFVIGVSPQRISFLTSLITAAGQEVHRTPDSSAFERELQHTRRKGQAGS